MALLRDTMIDANLLVLVGEDDGESSDNNNDNYNNHVGEGYYYCCYDENNNSMMLLPSDISNSNSSSSASSTITTSVASSTWRIMSKKNDEQERTATMTSSSSKNYTTITSRTHLSISQDDEEAYDEDGDSSLTKSTYCQYQHCPRPPNNNNKNGNSKVLGFAFYSFFIFTCVQAFYAIQSHSSSLLADTAAMFVDAGTYLFNMLAETWKASSAFSETMSMISSSTTKTTTTTSTTTTRLNLTLDEEEELNHDDDDDDGFGNDTTVVTQRGRTTTSKLHTLYLELLPPFFSVVALLYITCISFMDAIVVLYGHYYLSSPRNQEEENNNDDDDDKEAPNTKIMMVFAFVALVIDLLNVSCFSRVLAIKHTQHTTTTTNNNNNKEALCHGNSSPNNENNNATLLPSSECTPLISYQQSTDAFGKEMTTTRSRNSSSSSSRSSSSSNMNMYSAWTHVFADTLRSTAILLAGALSHFYPNFVLPVISDAIATIIVSCTIFFSCIPLVKGLNETWHGICSLKSEIHHREREEK